MTEMRRFNLSEYVERGNALFVEHWREVAEATGEPPPKVDLKMCATLEQHNMLLSIGIFDEDELVGYSVNVISPSLNFSDRIMACNEGLFVQPKHRGHWALRLIHETERACKEAGAVRFQCHTYKDTRAAMLFERLGYHPFDVMYTKEL